MSGDAKKPDFKSDEELWSYIEEQEALLNQMGDVFSKVRDEPSGHRGLSELPAPFIEMERLASEGNPAAQFNLSLAYKAGDGVAPDLEKAASWLFKISRSEFSASPVQRWALLARGQRQREGLRLVHEGCKTKLRPCTVPYRCLRQLG